MVSEGQERFIKEADLGKLKYTKEWFDSNGFKELDEVKQYAVDKNHPVEYVGKSKQIIIMTVSDSEGKPTKRKEALKTIPKSDISPSQLFDLKQKLITEGQSIPEDPNVATVYDIQYTKNHDNNDYDIVVRMQGFDAEDNMMEKAGSGLKLDELEAYVVQSAAMFDRLAGQGIYHKDIKPMNSFLIEDAAGNKYAKWLDFGVSSQMTEQYPNLGIYVTAAYVAPERMDQVLDPSNQELEYDEMKSEIYSFAATIYEATTGETYRYLEREGNNTQEKNANRAKVLKEAINSMDGLSQEQENILIQALLDKGMEDLQAHRFANALDIALKRNPNERNFDNMTSFSNGLLGQDIVDQFTINPYDINLTQNPVIEHPIQGNE